VAVGAVCCVVKKLLTNCDYKCRIKSTTTNVVVDGMGGKQKGIGEKRGWSGVPRRWHTETTQAPDKTITCATDGVRMRSGCEKDVSKHTPKAEETHPNTPKTA